MQGRPAQRVGPPAVTRLPQLRWNACGAFNTPEPAMPLRSCGVSQCFPDPPESGANSKKHAAARPKKTKKEWISDFSY